jgi:multiple sugar transport system ATP-binding protein
MNDVAPKDRDIAMVFQNYALYPHMTVYENMAFGLKIRKFPKPEINQRVHEAAAILDIEELLDRKPKALSGGQRQRVAVGRAIVRDPKVFLFDEPLSNLDAALRVSTRNELVNLHERLGATTIYVTHDQVEAMTMGSRICIIENGQLVQIGPPMEVYRRPANTFVAGFLGSPPMNLLPAALARAEDGRLTLRIGRQTVSVPREWDALMPGPSQVIFGIRPEDLFLQARTQDSERFAELELEVNGVEALGAETVMIFNLPGLDQTIFVKADRFARAGRGDRLRVWADLSAARLFDPRSRRVISGTN